MKTYTAKPHEIERKWYVVDAADQTLGRLAVQIANVLRGRHRPTFTPHVDTGDFVIVVNAERIRVTGRKAEKKVYQRYSGYPGGLREQNLSEMLEKYPDRVISIAVRGMLPRNRMRKRLMKKLKVYAGPDHPHEAQAPQPLDLWPAAQEASK